MVALSTKLDKFYDKISDSAEMLSDPMLESMKPIIWEARCITLFSGIMPIGILFLVREQLYTELDSLTERAYNRTAVDKVEKYKYGMIKGLIVDCDRLLDGQS